MLRTTQRIFTCFISVLQPGESKINTRCSIYIYVCTDCLSKARGRPGCVRVFRKIPEIAMFSNEISLPRARTTNAATLGPALENFLRNN